jgi:hypothetical protein
MLKLAKCEYVFCIFGRKSIFSKLKLNMKNTHQNRFWNINANIIIWLLASKMKNTDKRRAYCHENSTYSCKCKISLIGTYFVHIAFEHKNMNISLMPLAFFTSKQQPNFEIRYIYWSTPKTLSVFTYGRCFYLHDLNDPKPWYFQNFLGRWWTQYRDLAKHHPIRIMASVPPEINVQTYVKNNGSNPSRHFQNAPVRKKQNRYRIHG